ncbi:hypothetical protein KFK09_009648 [Dendrobium nobile]|uniref:Uncharacterized protein n=1 Tax=Dendrobium nobile TaxID=94219 RepID=A0A8T3BLI6_DENNO|nr:hypothetical protein KFK09_009648 [Dendrobium nobile]
MAPSPRSGLRQQRQLHLWLISGHSMTLDELLARHASDSLAQTKWSADDDTRRDIITWLDNANGTTFFAG